MRKQDLLLQLREEAKENINGISIDFIDNYTLESTSYICDSISDFADSQIDIYYYDLRNWLKEEAKAIEYFERSINEELIDSRNFDFDKCIQSAQYLLYTDLLYEDLESILKILVIDYLMENEKLLETLKFEEIEEFINGLDLDHNNKFNDIEGELLDLLDIEEEGE